MDRIKKIPFKQMRAEVTDTIIEDGAVLCPNCGEFIYEEDYEEIEIIDSDSEGRVYYCPICEFGF